MKKGRIITAAVLAATMLVGAGYAAWTDKLTVKNTVSTGELKVEFVKGEYNFGIFGKGLYAPIAGTSEVSYTKLNLKDPIYIGKSIKIQAPYAAANILSMDSKVLNVKIDNLYPGTLALITARMQNNGTIPAKFDNVKLEWDTANSKKLDKMKDKLMCAGGFVVLNKDGIPKVSNIFKGERFGDAFYNVKLKDLEKKLTDMLKDVRLEKGESIAFDIPEEYKDEVAANVEAYDPENQNCLLFYLPIGTDDNVKPEETVEDALAKFNILVNWKQHNAK